MDAGLLPIRGPRSAKQRLAHELGDEGREELALALALDALDLAASCSFLAWWVVTDDPGVANEAHERGLQVVTDDGAGLNAAVELGLGPVKAARADSVTILPADLPLALPGDVHDIVDTVATSSVVLVPSSDGGTNGLAMSPIDRFTPSFGPGSFATHLSLAEDQDLRHTVLALERLTLDLDTREDITVLLSKSPEGAARAYEVCARLVSNA